MMGNQRSYGLRIPTNWIFPLHVRIGMKISHIVRNLLKKEKSR